MSVAQETYGLQLHAPRITTHVQMIFGSVSMDAIVNQLTQNGHTNDEVRRPTREEAEAAVRTLIAWAGDDPSREGLLDTPKRVAKAYQELFSGYDSDPEEHLQTTFEEVGGYSDMVLLRGVPFYSFCEHHMVPFIGTGHIAYFPQAGVVGLSKLARVIDIYAKRLQTQENLTAQIVTSIEDNLQPRGLAVMLEAEHQCMTMRGVQKPGVSTITTRFTGLFEEDPALQMRFMSLVRSSQG